ncbi:MAG: tRNA (adenosine(37)-N6)-dimethylallyltransferase MiaA [Chloroflexi bacterium]|nr:tRNA (adenosine(37)-N6)-dimethylallyltransferase MiaA [Chloroflexota bacterium]
MSDSDPRLPLVALVGPTGVGKSALSLELAVSLNGEIVSADSRLFYRRMDIGTAKPTPEERRRIPHHLIDIAEPDEVWNLAMFQEAAYRAIEAIHARGRLPILVGGTGQFVQAIVRGWNPPGLDEDPKLRHSLELWGQDIGKQALHERLAFLDPQAAEKIDPRNVRRTIRAWEVILKTGRRFSTQREQGRPRYHILQVGVMRPREVLYERIDRRVDAMFSEGLVEEVRGLLKDYPPDLRSFSAIGYRQVIQHVLGELTEAEAKAQIKRATRVLIRRQAAWFKPGDPQIHWFSLHVEPVEQIIACIRKFLGSGKPEHAL